MKHAIGLILGTYGLLLLINLPVRAQVAPSTRDLALKKLGLAVAVPDARTSAMPTFRIPGKKVSQYTAEEWGAWIDSTWGPGQSAAQQLEVFDSFWTLVSQQWAGFPNLASSCAYWDSVRNVYRPQIGSGLSRGRFYALMSRMWMALSELHTYIYDPKVDQAFGSTSFKYRPGVPLLNVGPLLTSLLGAAVTPLPDSTNLVYRVAPDNPLHLEPGDLVLGYEGIPWKRLYPKLVDAGVPVSSWNSWPGSSPASVTQFWLMSVGSNWGLFDTIDIVKHTSGDTLHFPTARLDTTFQAIWQSDQVPVAGVLMPPTQAMDGPVTWGIVEGTNIGYVYVWDWYSSATGGKFSAAIHELCYTQGVHGLVIDCRMNWGGNFSRANAGLSQLFDFDPTANLRQANRSSGADCMAFSFGAAPSPFTPSMLYQHPIALLIGPGCFSVGDYNALRLRFHPMARLFGKPTNGAFVAGTDATGTLSDGWKYSFPTSMTYSLAPGGGYLLHRGTEPDEEVWLTRAGVAKGEDDVVKRALEWISGLVYAHNASVEPLKPRLYQDTLRIRTVIEDKRKHPIVAMAMVVDLTSGLVLQDSIPLFNDGLHSDGLPNDSIWGATFVPTSSGVYRVDIKTHDLQDSVFRVFSNMGTFATAGPVEYTGPKGWEFSSDTVAAPGATAYIRLGLMNKGSSGIIPAVTGLVEQLEEDDIVLGGVLNWGNLSPGVEVFSNSTIFSFMANPRNLDTASFAINIYSAGVQYWRDTINFKVTGIGTEKGKVPTEFALHQNYPNPFNPSTTIKYELPKTSHVSLAVYDILGRQVSVLVNERREAGYHEVRFEGTNLASGVYLYRLTAWTFTQTRKLLLLK